MDLTGTLQRIDEVLHRNRRVETWLMILTSLMFLAGIASIAMAIFLGELLWASPGGIITPLLYWPLKQIREMRKESLSLAIAPKLIEALPSEEAAVEIRRLLSSLIGNDGANRAPSRTIHVSGDSEEG